MSEDTQLSTDIKTDNKHINLNPYLSIEERINRHEIPIKKEFLKEVYADQNTSTDSRPSDNKEPPKKRGKYTKSSKKERIEGKKKNLFQGKGFCSEIGLGKECKKDKCKFSHDLDTFLKEKPADISDSCYIYDKTGKCPFGYRCRFSNSHCKDGKLMINEEKVKEYETKPLETINIIEWETIRKLRKKQIPFTKTIKVLKDRKYDLGFLSKISNDVDNSNIVIPDKVKKTVDWKNKLVLAPLTTIGNLPFRRICKGFGVDITVGEMALATQLLSGSLLEWALIKKHTSEDVFGIQLAGSHPNSLAACAELLTDNYEFDFIDINCGCPIDLICNKGAGSTLLYKKNRLESICKSMIDVMDAPLTIKIRTGYHDKKPTAHSIIPNVKEWGVSAVTLHGRSREQRYTKCSDIKYMERCASLSPVPFICNGDIYSWQDAINLQKINPTKSVMVARGAIIKPWIFKEIKEQKDYDISGSERLDIIQNFVNYGLEHWGSDDKGVENIRHFLLNWMSFLYRYVPVGIIEHFPVKINHRPPMFMGRDDKETLLSSPSASDWVKISEMFLGPVPNNFNFVPKHKANSYSS